MAEATTVQSRKPVEAGDRSKTARNTVQARIDAIETEAKKRLDAFLESGNARLSKIDTMLARVSKEDWTFTGMRRRLEGLRSRAENAGNSALRRVDEIPAEAVSAIASASRARIQDLSRGIQAIARKLEPQQPPARGNGK